MDEHHRSERSGESLRLGHLGQDGIEQRAGTVGARGLELHKKCFWDENLVVRNSGDMLQFSPFLNSRPEDITMTFGKVRKVLDSID